jgi:hypothetical protein
MRIFSQKCQERKENNKFNLPQMFPAFSFLCSLCGLCAFARTFYFRYVEFLASFHIKPRASPLILHAKQKSGVTVHVIHKLYYATSSENLTLFFQISE